MMAVCLGLVREPYPHILQQLIDCLAISRSDRDTNTGTRDHVMSIQFEWCTNHFENSFGKDTRVAGFHGVDLQNCELVTT